MTKTFPNLVRLLVVLAMLCSLVAITVAPATAAISAVTCTASPMTAGSTASYTITWTQASAVTALGTVTVEFPAGVTLPTSIDNQLISLTGVAFATTDPDPTVSGQKVIITIPTGQTLAAGAARTLIISQGAGLTNPGIAYRAAQSAYPVKVNTSVETTQATGYMGVIPSYTISPITGDRSTVITITGKGWTPNGAITIKNAGTTIATGTAQADGTFSVTGTAQTSGNMTCTDGAGQTETYQTGTTAWDSSVTVPTFTMKARLVLSPTSGNVGSTFKIYGYDYTSGSSVAANSVTMGGTAITHSATGAFTLELDAYGTNDDFMITDATVPDTMSGGAKTIVVTDAATKFATATFTVNTPTMTIDPASGAPNTMVTITGANFKANDSIPINGLDYAGANWNTAAITIDSSGSWTYSIRVPASTVSGNNPVTVTTTAGTTASAIFAAGTRSLTLNPTSGPSGTKVTVSGANMTAGGSIAIGGMTFAGAAWNTAAITIDSLRNISPSTLVVPNSSATGANTVSATDSGSLTATATFTVTQPTIEVTPTSGYKGDTLTVTGSGWVPGSLGLVTLTFNAVTQVVTTPGVDGTFTAQFTVPLTAVSGQLVGASDTYGNSAAPKAFLISDAAISITPATGPMGTEVTVTGQGFQPQTAVQALTIGGGSVLPTTALVTDTFGGFTSTFTVPGLATGAQTVSANVLGVIATTFFTISQAAATTKSVVASISNELTRIWGYSAGAWQMYDPADPVGSDLASLTAGDGYWFLITEDVTLIYGGHSYSLTAGWNLKGWQG